VRAQALEHSETVSNHLRQCIVRAGGWLSFERWMTEVLYAPGLGYYSAGSTKLAARHTQNQAGLAGDFVTAPELSPAFGRTLAQQVAQVLADCADPKILEFGAGSGQLAHDILEELKTLGFQTRYEILELSADLKQRQQQTLAPWGEQVRWVDNPGPAFDGVILANEVLDAMPVHIVGFDQDGQAIEQGVIWTDDGFAWQSQPASERLTETLKARLPALPGYITELNLAAEAWIQQINDWLSKGVAFIIDYGFTASEFFHPQRHTGTLMCHIQHTAHDNPFFAPGLQDITAHVDFSAMAAAAHRSGLEVMGFTSQARFLINAGLATQAARLNRHEARALEKLVSEAEMGELFKVLAVGKQIDLPLMGFSHSDRRHQL
jgi:SAM-dependent MidA family methyltransferase